MEVLLQPIYGGVATAYTPLMMPGVSQGHQCGDAVSHAHDDASGVSQGHQCGDAVSHAHDDAIILCTCTREAAVGALEGSAIAMAGTPAVAAVDTHYRLVVAVVVAH